MSEDTTVPGPPEVHGRAPQTGGLEPALRWLASCQGAWPPGRPAAPRRVDVPAGAPGTFAGGLARADAAVDSGADLLVVSGSGHQAQGLLVLATLLDLEPVRAVGTTGGPDWTDLVVAVRDGLGRARVHRTDPESLVRVVQASAVAELAGLLAGASTRRTPVLLDGSANGAAAAVVAERLRPGAARWWLAAMTSDLPAGRLGHGDAGVGCLLDLRVGLAAGADLGLEVLCRAVDLLAAADRA